MKFGKEYASILLNPSFPPEWRDRAIAYRELKKLINNVVDELTDLGLNPDVLHQLFDAENVSTSPEAQRASVEEVVDETIHQSKGKERHPGERPAESKDHLVIQPETISKVSYEYDVNPDSSPRLHLWLANTQPFPSSEINLERVAVQTPSPEAPNKTLPKSGPHDSSSETNSEDPADLHETLLMASTAKYQTLGNPIWLLSKQENGDPAGSVETIDSGTISDPRDGAAAPDVVLESADPKTKELVISLQSDAAFFHLLGSALQSLADLQHLIQDQFTAEIKSLSETISHTIKPHSKGKSDLEAWRQVFQLWVESEIFESSREKDRGERPIGDIEKRLTKFAQEVVKRGLGDRRTLKSKESRGALERFLQINVQLLDLRKFQQANAEAARKILKKREKRTALALPSAQKERILSLLLSLSPAKDPTTGQVILRRVSLAHILITQLTDTLLPIIPSIDDYLCLICTSIAFKPIRLSCGHLFCVRCLAKMQKRGQAHCPLCRAHTVLQADRTNVDWALLKFMQDWFPKEAKEKKNANETEKAKEDLEEMGLDTKKCFIM